jgi:hypothetical protein
MVLSKAELRLMNGATGRLRPTSVPRDAFVASERKFGANRRPSEAIPALAVGLEGLKARPLSRDFSMGLRPTDLGINSVEKLGGTLGATSAERAVFMCLHGS